MYFELISSKLTLLFVEKASYFIIGFYIMSFSLGVALFLFSSITLDNFFGSAVSLMHGTICYFLLVSLIIVMIGNAFLFIGYLNQYKNVILNTTFGYSCAIITFSIIFPFITRSKTNYTNKAIGFLNNNFASPTSHFLCNKLNISGVYNNTDEEIILDYITKRSSRLSTLNMLFAIAWGVLQVFLLLMMYKEVDYTLTSNLIGNIKV